MNKHLKQTLVAVVMTILPGIALGDPPRASHDHWRNTNHGGHYVLYDSPSRTYVETINCQPAYRFTLVRNEMNTLTIYDASRDMTVRLDYSGMWLKPSGAADFSFYQAGTFDTRDQFQHVDANGTYTGAITKLDGCRWVEWFAGASAPTYYFEERGTTANHVELYDGSRDIWVRMEANRMLLRFGNDPFAFFKKGKW